MPPGTEVSEVAFQSKSRRVRGFVTVIRGGGGISSWGQWSIAGIQEKAQSYLTNGKIRGSSSILSQITCGDLGFIIEVMKESPKTREMYQLQNISILPIYCSVKNKNSKLCNFSLLI